MSTELAGAGKLTKKQQKALRHRTGERKGKGKGPAKGKGKGKERETAGDVPEEDLVDEDAAPTAVSPVKKESKKRKRQGDAEDEEELLQEGEEGAGKDSPKKQKQPKKSKERKPRFIVFVGNLPYKVTTEDIIGHFAEACEETPSVRLLTPKTPKNATAEDASTALAKSKGCAFVEFTTSTALQAALHLHQSTFVSSATKARRKINVELTAGGGGNSASRRDKLSQTKERLEKQRENHRTVQDEEKAKKEEEKQKVREEWKQKNKEMAADGQPAMKKRKVKPPRWLTGANAAKLG